MAKILMIEDEHNLRNSVLGALEYEGFETFGTGNGRQGIQFAKEYRPDLILCDIVMPELNGYDVLSELRRDPLTRPIPFIFLTGKTGEEDFRRGTELGADDYITKPFNFDVMLSVIQNRLNRQAVMSQQIKELRVNLASALPHELRTPLTGIMGYSSFLINLGEERLPEPGEILEMQTVIYNNALHLHRLIENYLLYVKLKFIESGLKSKESCVWYSADVVNAMNAIIPFATGIAEKFQRQGDLILEPVDVDIRISGIAMQRIVEELLVNAFKFSKPGTPVRVVIRRDGNRCILSIMDQGRSMTDEQIASIGAYMQFDREKYEQQGVGLGLMIAKLLTQLHDGELTIDSEVNQGTTVNVSFPKL